MESVTVEFILDKKYILNSNAMPSHFIVKGKMVNYLREEASRKALALHAAEQHDKVQKQLDRLADEKDLMLRKKRHKSKLKKLHPKMTEKELKQQIELDFASSVRSDDETIESIEPLFNSFIVQASICPPSRRRLDPPNLYPTVKAIIDGFTDAGVWIDDNFEYLKEMSFVYGGLSEIKDHFRVILTITEVPPDYNSNVASDNEDVVP